MTEDEKLDLALYHDVRDTVNLTAVARRWSRTARTIESSERLLDETHFGGCYVSSITFRLPDANRDTILAVVSGVGHTGMKVVGFHSADTMTECIVGTLNRILNGTMIFREDKYAKGTD